MEFQTRINSDHIKRTMHLFAWESALSNLETNEQLSVFNSTNTNIAKNFLPNETIICDHRDPHSVHGFIERLLLTKYDF